MTMDMFTAWRAEIEAELVAARERVHAANTELAAAVEAERTATNERRLLNAALSRLGDRRPMATALRNRAHHHTETFRAQESRLARARGEVAAALYQVQDLTDALAQLDLIDPPAPALEPAADAAISIST